MRRNVLLFFMVFALPLSLAPAKAASVDTVLCLAKGLGVPVPVPTDCDGDGYASDVDCDDANAAVHPGAQDQPDLFFADANCDGIDGDESKAVFLASSGNDSGPGTKTQPMRTSNPAIAKALATGRTQVLASAGTYDGSTRDGTDASARVGGNLRRDHAHERCGYVRRIRRFMGAGGE